MYMFPKKLKQMLLVTTCVLGAGGNLLASPETPEEEAASQTVATLVAPTHDAVLAEEEYSLFELCLANNVVRDGVLAHLPLTDQYKVLFQTAPIIYNAYAEKPTGSLHRMGQTLYHALYAASLLHGPAWSALRHTFLQGTEAQHQFFAMLPTWLRMPGATFSLPQDTDGKADESAATAEPPKGESVLDWAGSPVAKAFLKAQQEKNANAVSRPVESAMDSATFKAFCAQDPLLLKIVQKYGDSSLYQQHTSNVPIDKRLNNFFGTDYIFHWRVMAYADWIQRFDYDPFIMGVSGDVCNAQQLAENGGFLEDVPLALLRHVLSADLGHNRGCLGDNLPHEVSERFMQAGEGTAAVHPYADGIMSVPYQLSYIDVGEGARFAQTMIDHFPSTLFPHATDDFQEQDDLLVHDFWQGAVMHVLPSDMREAFFSMSRDLTVRMALKTSEPLSVYSMWDRPFVVESTPFDTDLPKHYKTDAFAKTSAPGLVPLFNALSQTLLSALPDLNFQLPAGCCPVCFQSKRAWDWHMMGDTKDKPVTAFRTLQLLGFFTANLHNHYAKVSPDQDYKPLQLKASSCAHALVSAMPGVLRLLNQKDIQQALAAGMTPSRDSTEGENDDV